MAGFLADKIREPKVPEPVVLKSPAGGPHLDESLKMGAPGLDFQTWDSVDTRLAKELGIEVSHVSESRHGAPKRDDVDQYPVGGLALARMTRHGVAVVKVRMLQWIDLDGTVSWAASVPSSHSSARPGDRHLSCATLGRVPRA